MDNFRTKATEEYHHVRNYLNVLELIALGIENKVLSEVVCEEYWNDFVIQALDDCALIIEYMCGLTGSELAFGALLSVGSRWRRRKNAPKRTPLH
jgi:hypothetical protein